MERRLNKKTETFLHQMKADIAEQFQCIQNKTPRQTLRCCAVPP